MDSTLTTTDALQLAVREWPCADARGSVLIVHGLGEHCGRYARLAAQLNTWGWAAVGYDHRGHGASQGERGAIASPEALLADLALLIDSMRATHSGPLVLLGHSLGGLVAARFCAPVLAGEAPAWRRQVEALVLSSPALDLGMNRFQKLLLALLGPLAPQMALNNGLNPEWVSRDPAVVKAYVDDPLVHDRVTPRLVQFIVDGGKLVRERAAAWAVPTLLLYAASDRCVAPAGSAAFAARAPKARLTAHEFAPLDHEIVNEPERAEVFGVLGSWLARRAH